MITTLLPKEQVDVLRSIGDAANVFMALFLIDRLYPGHSTTLRELGNLFGTDKRTIEKRLNSLCGSDRVIFDGHGYVLMEGGRALFLAAAPSLPAMPPELQSGAESLEWDTIEALAPSLGHDQAPLEAQALDIDLEAVPPMPEDPPMDGECAQNVRESEETTTRALRALLEEEDINLIDSESDELNTSSIDSRSAQNVHFENSKNLQTSGPAAQPGQNGQRRPTTLQILDATSLLFEKTMTTSGIADKPRRVAIGWVAQAWDQRKFLRSPQGLIYKRLSADPVQMPQEKYYDHPRKYLPESYLVAIGLMTPRAAEELIIPEPHVAEPEAEPERVEALDDVPVDQAAVNAWEKVLGQLQGEMHRAPFESWVRDTRGIRFDRNALVIGTKSTTGREWLESRIRKTAERMLVGILARSVDVVFVVAN
jgi:hypothetical protein